MNYGERLKKARGHAGLTQAGLADAIGNACSQENISKLERGNATGSEYTALFASACGVNHFWLATGKEAMLSRDAPPGASPSYNVAKKDFDFIRRLNDLPGECRRTLEIMLAEQERLIGRVQASAVEHLLQQVNNRKEMGVSRDIPFTVTEGVTSDQGTPSHTHFIDRDKKRTHR